MGEGEKGQKIALGMEPNIQMWRLCISAVLSVLMTLITLFRALIYEHNSWDLGWTMAYWLKIIKRGGVLQLCDFYIHKYSGLHLSQNGENFSHRSGSKIL